MSVRTHFGALPSSTALEAFLEPHLVFLATICEGKRRAFQYIHHRGASGRSAPRTADFELYTSLEELKSDVQDAHDNLDETQPPWGDNHVLETICKALYAAPRLIFELKNLLDGVENDSYDSEGAFVNVTQAGVDSLRQELLPNLLRMYQSAARGV